MFLRTGAFGRRSERIKLRAAETGARQVAHRAEKRNLGTERWLHQQRRSPSTCENLGPIPQNLHKSGCYSEDLKSWCSNNAWGGGDRKLFGVARLAHITVSNRPVSNRVEGEGES